MIFLFLVAWLPNMGSSPLLSQRGLGFIDKVPQVSGSSLQRMKRQSRRNARRWAVQWASLIQAHEEASQCSGHITSPSLRNRAISPLALFLSSLLQESMDLYQAKLFPGSAIVILIQGSCPAPEEQVLCHLSLTDHPQSPGLTCT